MTAKTKKTIGLTGLICLFWIVLGYFEFLPAFFFNTYLGQSHSIFAPLSILLDIALYIFFAYALAAIIAGIIDR